MTEAEWQSSTDPRPMMDSLEGQADDRRIRLFSVACCRRIWAAISDDRCLNAIAVAEAHADGLVPDRLRRKAGRAALEADGCAEQWASLRLLRIEASECWKNRSQDYGARYGVPDAVAIAVGRNASNAADRASLNTEYDIRKRELEVAKEKAEVAERVEQAALLRDIFGNPFRPVQLDLAWLDWNTGTVRKLAQTIYDERRFDDLPILADALEEAGCTEAAILEHCRGPGPHVRGCWVVDLLLDKE